jgi:hypothetical protein
MLNLSNLTKKTKYKIFVKAVQIVRKPLDWMEKTAILALGSEEC